jgi:hypothetical protein
MQHDFEFCSGLGDAEFIKLVSDSYAHFTATPQIPNLAMLIDQNRDTLVEGFYWNGWWIQNSYGFTLGVLPYLDQPFFSLLQKSLDLFWDRIGDGKRKGYDQVPENIDNSCCVVGADGSLGDAVIFDKQYGPAIIYKMGDGYQCLDWFYEATAAGVVMQTSLLLRTRSIEDIKKYLPLIERSCAHIERTRDPRNDLFLVGGGSNLLAPSFGGAIDQDGNHQRSYLTGLSITYGAALERMAMLYALLGDTENEKRYLDLYHKTKAALNLLKADGGYYVKSMETDGTKHGIYGAKKHGYFEAVANIDAIALDMADDETADAVYHLIQSAPEMRLAHMLPTNYPELDDRYLKYGSIDLQVSEDNVMWKYGNYLDGGVWGTVEGRAVFAYMRLKKYEDAVKSVQTNYRWTKNYRMDEPYCQAGVNSFNYWSDAENVPQVSVMIDNFAIPANFIRGIFGYRYSPDTLTLTPHLPGTVTSFTQKFPVFWGKKELHISCINGRKVIGATVNGAEITSFDDDHVYLDYDALPNQAEICVKMSEGTITVLTAQDSSSQDNSDTRFYNLTFENTAMQAAYQDACKLYLSLSRQEQSDYLQKLGRTTLQAASAACQRRVMPFDENNSDLRPMTSVKIGQIYEIYDSSFLRLYNLFKNELLLSRHQASNEVVVNKCE